ncbi:hypothetical protein CLAIMM_11422, partial [Cladophialophora immunda]
ARLNWPNNLRGYPHFNQDRCSVFRCILTLAHVEKKACDPPELQLITTIVNTDIPLTLTEITHDTHGRQVILLSFPYGHYLLDLLRQRTALASVRCARDLDASLELGQMELFTFNFTCAITPLFLAPFCELARRRLVNIATILVFRAFLGLFGSVGTILVSGTFSDLFPADESARPMDLEAKTAGKLLHQSSFYIYTYYLLD